MRFFSFSILPSPFITVVGSFMRVRVLSLIWYQNYVISNLCFMLQFMLQLVCCCVYVAMCLM